jgi:predicted AlkP superfamily phosphohydrolase/phosphomutase
MALSHKQRARVFVIGLDGATFDILEPWMDAGDLPTLHHLVNSGVSGELESTYPPLTGPAWGSFMTGKTPVNHGVLEFFRRAPQSYQQVLHSRKDLDGRSIWRVLSDAGTRVGVVGVPLTYPPEEVNGFLVTGLLTPRRSDVTFTHPPELGAELDSAVGGYLLQHEEKYLQDDPLRLIREEESILDSLIDAALYLIDSKPWDFFMLHVLGSDVMQHAFWHFMDPDHPEYDPRLGEQYGNPILEFWKRVDRRLAEVLDKLPQETHVMVMSDHGFGRVVKYINFNVWLLQSGFIQLKKDARSRLRYLAFRLGYNYATAFKIGFRTGLLRQIIRMGRGKQENLQRQMFLSLDDVDWPQSQVYSVGNFGQMYVNLKGREPLGRVSPGREYEQVLQRLETELRAMRDPDSGQAVIGDIWRGTDLFQGEYAHRAPDLFFFTRDMEYKAMGLTDFGSNRVFDDLYGTHAHHRMNGVFVLKGPGVRQGERIEGARLVDLAPTIYALMGVPVPQDLDGRTLQQAFVPGYEPEAQQERESVDKAGPSPDQVYTPEEEALVMEQLRNLGYVE